jgi:3-hydroxyisobutyrate dehydrogenase-like beta-hydroxyacid dehydrogenase
MMIGGAADDVQAAAGILEAITPVRFHAGPCGAGARMKLIVNLVLGLNRAVLAEGLAFAEACGVDAGLALAVLKASPAYSRAMDVKGAKMISRDYTPEARLRQHRKDVRLIIEESERNGAGVPLTRLHDELLEQAERAGYADLDNSAIIEILRRASR